MSKGINTIVEETKVELINLVNSKLEMGLPISVVGVIFDNVSNQIKLHTVNAIKMEEDRAEKEDNVKDDDKKEGEE